MVNVTVTVPITRDGTGQAQLGQDVVEHVAPAVFAGGAVTDVGQHVLEAPSSARARSRSASVICRIVPSRSSRQSEKYSRQVLKSIDSQHH
jgi:hypothetical protein